MGSTGSSKAQACSHHGFAHAPGRRPHRAARADAQPPDLHNLI